MYIVHVMPTMYMYMHIHVHEHKHVYAYSISNLIYCNLQCHCLYHSSVHTDIPFCSPCFTSLHIELQVRDENVGILRGVVVADSNFDRITCRIVERSCEVERTVKLTAFAR